MVKTVSVKEVSHVNEQTTNVPTPVPTGFSFDDAPVLHVGNQTLSNMQSLESDKYFYSLNSSTRGCLREGAIPLALAMNDTCNLGFYCVSSRVRSLHSLIVNKLLDRSE
jgi:hypothetical protein